MKIVVLLTGAALGSIFSAAAQTTFATITGMVTDPQGAAISGASHRRPGKQQLPVQSALQ